MKDHLKKLILRLFPEFSGGLHLDRYARVLAISDPPEMGSSSERFRPRLAVDIEVLNPDLEPDDAFPKYTAVPLPVPIGSGGESGAFAFPDPGALVVIGFAYGRQDHPIIRQIYSMGESLPQVYAGELLFQRSPDVFQKADKEGNWLRKTSTDITDESVTRHIKAQECISEISSEKKLISENSHTEIDGTSTLEVATNLSLLAGTRADLGTLGAMNLTAGADSTHTTGNNALETVGGDHKSTVNKNRNINIKGARSSEIKKGQSSVIGQDNNLKVGGTHTDEASGDRNIFANNITLTAKDSLTITSESHGGINLFGELLSALDEIKSALDVLAQHDHPNTGTINQSSPVANHSKGLGEHRGNMGKVTK